MLISYIVAYPLSLPLMYLFWFSRWRWIYLCAHGIDLLGPAGDNPHAIGTGMEKGPKPEVTSFCWRAIWIFLLYTLTIFFLFYFYFIYFFINCALAYINFFCLFAFVIDLFTTTNITLCIYLNNNILFFTLGLVFYIKLILKN